VIDALFLVAYVGVIVLGLWLGERYRGKTWADVARDLRAAMARIGGAA
jgi:hypothetical protein